MDDHTVTQESVTNSSQEESTQIRQKRALEIALIANQLSKRAEAREWLKAATPILGAFALLWTVYIGIGQLREGAATKAQERFEAAVNHTNSREIRERLTGIATLESLLKAAPNDRHQAILEVLVNALAVEDDIIVRAALLDLFRHLDASQLGPAVLNSTLLSVVTRNRALKLAGGYLPEGPVSPKLQALGLVLVQLLRKGAYTQDLSDTYCFACDFSELDLHSVTFQNALLTASRFKKTNLSGAIFSGAWLGFARFHKANLRNARFSGNDYNLFDHFRRNPGAVPRPFFDCADLSGSNFDAYAVSILLIDPQGKSESYSIFSSYNANVTGADFRKSTIMMIHNFHKISTPPFHNFLFENVEEIGPEGMQTTWEPQKRKAILEHFGPELTYSKGWREAKLPEWLRDALKNQHENFDTKECDIRDKYDIY